MRSICKYLPGFFYELFGRIGLRIERTLPAFSSNKHNLLSVDFDFIIRDFMMAKGESYTPKFIQIGAFDGVHDDPIHDYVVQYNWEGLLVEPQSYYFQRLQDTYAKQEGLDLFKGAVGRSGGFKTLYTVNPEAEDLPEWAGVYASFDRETLLKGDPISEDHVREERVRIEHPMTLLESNDLLDVDIVQIDVEGFDSEVLRMLNFNVIQPAVIQFEHRF